MGLQFVFTSAPLGARPYQMASFSPDFTEGEISVRREVFAGRLPLYPLQYPLDELVMVHLLARGRGVAIHGAASSTPTAAGRCSPGQSGAGKTTMARLWLPEPGVKISATSASCCARKAMSSGCTARPGTGTGTSPTQGRAPLDRICFLRHAPRNQMTAVAATASIARLFACCFPPFYDAAGLDDVLGSLERIAASCRSVELGFVPDATAPAFVRRN